MQLDHKPWKVFVTGTSGTGKTTFWLRLLVGTPARLKFVFDDEGEVSARLRLKAATCPEEIGAMARQGWVIYDPGRMFPGRTEAAFEWFCQFAFAASKATPGRKLFACDELQKIVGTSKCPPGLALLLQTGRRYGLDAQMISQQPNVIHNSVRNQITEVVTFRQADHRAVEWLEMVGMNRERVLSLSPGAFYSRCLLTGSEDSGRVF